MKMFTELELRDIETRAIRLADSEPNGEIEEELRNLARAADRIERLLGAAEDEKENDWEVEVPK